MQRRGRTRMLLVCMRWLWYGKLCCNCTLGARAHWSSASCSCRQQSGACQNGPVKRERESSDSHKHGQQNQAQQARSLARARAFTSHNSRQTCSACLGVCHGAREAADEQLVGALSHRRGQGVERQQAGVHSRAGLRGSQVRHCGRIVVARPPHLQPISAPFETQGPAAASCGAATATGTTCS